MPTIVNIPNVGRVRFPDEMSREEIDTESRNLYEKSFKVPEQESDFSKGRVASGVASAARGLVEGIGQSISGLGRYASGLTAAIPETIEPGTNPSAEEYQRNIESRQAESGLMKLGSDIQSGAREAYKTNPEYQGEFLADVVPSALGSTAAAASVGALTGPVGAAVQYGFSQAESQAQDAEAAGKPEHADLEFLAALPLGIASEATLGAAPAFWKIIKKLRQSGVDPKIVAKPLARLALETGAFETGQEITEQTGQNAISWAHDPNRPILEGTGTAGAAGFVVGTLTGAGGALVGNMARRQALKRVEAQTAAKGAPATAQALATTATTVKPGKIDESSIVTQIVALNQNISNLKASQAAGIKVADEVNAAINAFADSLPEQSTPAPNADQISSSVELPSGQSPGASPQVAARESGQVQGAPEAQVKEEGAGVQGLTEQQPSTEKGVPNGKEEGRKEVQQEVRNVTATQEPVASTQPVPPVLPLGQQRSTSTKNAIVDAERVMRGLQALDPEMSQSQKETIQRATDTINSDDLAGPRVVEELRNGSTRSISVEDEAILLVWKRHLMNEREDLEALLEDEKVDPVTKSVAEKNWSDINDQLGEIDEATRASGAIWGRFGRLRQRMILRDFSLENVLKRARIAKGESLTREEHAKIKEQAQKIEDLQKQIDALNQKKQEDKETAALDDIVSEVTGEVDAESKEDEKVKSLAERIVVALENQAESARSRLREKLQRASAGIDPTILSDVVVIGTAKLARFSLNKARWIRAMIDDLGEGVVPYLDSAWEESNKQLDSKIESVAGTQQSRAVKKAVTNETPQEKIEGIKGRIQGRATEGQTIDDMRFALRALAKQHIASGIREREALIKAVHSDVAPFFEGLTEKDVRVAMTGYGSQQKLSKDEIDVTLRDLLGQDLQVLKIEDMKSGIAPKKTGKEQRERSDKERALIKEVNELKKKGGFVSTDPESELKTAMAAIETRLRNEIVDLDNAIEKNEAIKNRKRSIEYSDEAKRLRTERDAKKAIYDQMFPPPAKTEAEKQAAWSRNLDVQIQKLSEDLASSRLYSQPAPGIATTPEIESKKAELTRLRELRQAMRSADWNTVNALRLETALKALDRSMDKVRADIKAGGRTTGTKKEVFTHPEVQAKQAHLAALKAERDSLEKSNVALQESKIIERLKQKKAELEANLTYGPKPESPESKEPLSTPEIEKMQSEIDALQEQIDRRDNGPLPTDEEAALARKKARIKSSIEKMRNQIASGDVAPKAKADVKVDDEARKLRLEQQKIKRQLVEMQLQWRLSQRTTKEVLFDSMKELLNTARAVTTGYDLSAVGRQGWFLSVSHPAVAAKSFGTMMRSLSSEKSALKAHEDIINDPMYELAAKSKLYIADENDVSMNKVEEEYQGRWARKIPGQQAFQRAFTAYLNNIRFSSFKVMIAALGKNDQGVSLNDAKAISKFINIATGRAPLGDYEASAKNLATIFFAPRYSWSRFQLVGGYPIWGNEGSGRVKRLIAQEMAKSVLGMIAFTALTSLYFYRNDREKKFGFSLNPTSSDFLKLVIGGRTRIDLWTGLIQSFVYLNRMVLGKSTSIAGKETNLRPEKKQFGQQTGFDVTSTYARGKLAPGPATVMDVASGSDITGKPFSLFSPSDLFNKFGPMTVNDIKDAFKTWGLDRDAFVQSFLSIFGFGVNQYEDRPAKK